MARASRRGEALSRRGIAATAIDPRMPPIDLLIAQLINVVVAIRGGLMGALASDRPHLVRVRRGVHARDCPRYTPRTC